jgi:hypothetical protein
MKAGERAIFRATDPDNSRYDGQQGTVMGPGLRAESVTFLFDDPRLNRGLGVANAWRNTQLDNLEPIPT